MDPPHGCENPRSHSSASGPRRALERNGVATARARPVGLGDRRLARDRPRRYPGAPRQRRGCEVTSRAARLCRGSDISSTRDASSAPSERRRSCAPVGARARGDWSRVVPGATRSTRAVVRRRGVRPFRRESPARTRWSTGTPSPGRGTARPSGRAVRTARWSGRSFQYVDGVAGSRHRRGRGRARHSSRETARASLRDVRPSGPRPRQWNRARASCNPSAPSKQAWLYSSDALADERHLASGRPPRRTGVGGSTPERLRRPWRAATSFKDRDVGQPCAATRSRTICDVIAPLGCRLGMPQLRSDASAPLVTLPPFPPRLSGRPASRSAAQRDPVNKWRTRAGRWRRLV